MNPILPSMKLGDKGPSVANLQDALLLLLNNQIIRTLDAPNRPTADELKQLAEGLKQERAQSLFGKATFQLMVYFQVQQGLGDNLRGAVEDKTAAKLNVLLNSLGALTQPSTLYYTVRGEVRFSNGTPAAGALVRAFDKDLRSRQQLGTGDFVTADENGQYRIAYTADQFSRSESEGADLQIEARKDSSSDWIAAPVRFNAPPDCSIDVTIDGAFRGPAEFNLVVNAITPLLDGITLAQVTEGTDFQDVTFLSNDTGIDRQLVFLLAESARRVAENDRLLQEEYYGLFRQHLPTDLESLLARDPADLSAALQTSSEANIIRFYSDADLADFVARIEALQANQALRPSVAEKPASLGDLLTVAIDPALQPVVAKLYLGNGGATDSFWQALEKDGGIKPQDASAVKLTLGLGELTGNHLPLVRALYQMGRDKATYADLQGFAQLDENDWQALLQRPQDPSDPHSPPIGFPSDQANAASYAQSLADSVEAAYPMAVMTNRLNRDTSDQSPFKAAKPDLLQFFSNNPGFSFAETPPDLYFADGAPEKLRGVNDPETLGIQLKRIRRVSNLTPRFREISALLADDLHSAAAIVGFGQRKFIEKYSGPLGSPDRAKEVYDNARQVNATSFSVYLKHAAAFNFPTPYVISGGPVTAPAASGAMTVRSLTLNYAALFGSSDLCDCPHCQSLYSPSAYFVDILKFLGDGPTKNGVSPLQVLLDRRPDLEQIELTCDNTNLELPYVDLTNELLEAAVASRKFQFAEDATQISSVLASLAAGSLPPWIKTAFANHDYPLTDQATVRVDRTEVEIDSSEWIIFDAGWVFVLRHQGTNEGFVVTPWPQTSWTPDELSANPEHTNDPAYDQLKQAVYPWTLPLNLPLEEARTYLGNLGVSRSDLIKTFNAGGTLDRQIALEYIGLSQEESDIIAGVTTGGPAGPPSAGPWDFWGLAATGNDLSDRYNPSAPNGQGDWDVVLPRVSLLLQQSGLAYKELLELLGTYFINPIASPGTPGGRVLGIVSDDPNDLATCDLSKLEILVIDSTIADKKGQLTGTWNRIHPLVRLWRKTGWTLRDLDKAITAENAQNSGALDMGVFVGKISAIQRLQVRTNLPILTLLSWWGDIDIAGYTDHLADGEPPVPSLYAQLFSNRTVAGAILPENPGSLTGALSDYASAISSALQISLDDFGLLKSLAPADTLSLANLSLLYRHATFAAVLGLSIQDHLAALALIGGSPFASPADTAKYIEQIAQVRDSGFTLDDLDYLLRHEASIAYDLSADDDGFALVLDTLRDALAKVSLDNTFVEVAAGDTQATTDPTGDLTRKKLGLLNWDPVLIENIIAVLRGIFVYQTDLSALAPAVQLPESLRSKISYDSVAGKLSFAGTMTTADQTLLVAAPNTDPDFVAAVARLFQAPRDFVTRYLARFSIPTFSVAATGPALQTLLAGIKFPASLKAKLYYEASDTNLVFVGVMTEAERNLALTLSTDTSYSALIQFLFAAPQLAANQPVADQAFLTTSGPTSDVVNLFAFSDEQSDDRFLSILKKLLPYLKLALSELTVKQQLGEFLQLDATAIDGLLKRWIMPRSPDPARPEQRAISDFLNPVFSESRPSLKVSREAFPSQFDALTLLRKIALLIGKFRITPTQLQWLFVVPAAPAWLDFNALPLADSAGPASLFPNWARLADLFRLRDSLPRGEALLTDIFTLAAQPGSLLTDILTRLSQGTQWNLESLTTLCSASGFNFSPVSFRDEIAPLTLSAAIALLNRLGASAGQGLAWTKSPPTSDSARDLKNLVRAKYDGTEWLELAKSLRDPLRECQRSALVSQLIQQLQVLDANELYERFLIDVEMSPCMMTTRIEQAINSVQLFIQRCFLNLEPEVYLTPDEAQEWSQWRKQYRVWEANRKILFYPENWLEPELRDDKSPFYQDLENKLLQSDVTVDSAEDAFLEYLEKLDEAARLDIRGVCLQPEIDPDDKAVMHVIGRTYATPFHHYYRRLEGTRWTAWEKLDLDIEGDHLIPVVWNRRLYLFWAIFTETPDRQSKGERDNNDDPMVHWEIKFAWAEYKNSKWSAKKLSQQTLSLPKHVQSEPYQKTTDYTFQTRVVTLPSGAALALECFGTYVERSTTPIVAPAVGPNEVYIVSLEAGPAVEFDFMQAQDQEPPLTVRGSGTPHDIMLAVSGGSSGSSGGTVQTANGPALTVAMNYYLETTRFSVVSVTRNEEWATVSNDDYVLAKVRFVVVLSEIPPVTVSPTMPMPVYFSMQAVGRFVFDDSLNDLRVYSVAEAQPPIYPPPPTPLEPIFGTELEAMMMVENVNYNQGTGLGASRILRVTPTQFRLLGQTQTYAPSIIAKPFIFQDEARTYLVTTTGTTPNSKTHFDIFFHPRVRDFIRALNHLGIDGLLTLANQRLADSPLAFDQYQPNASVDSAFPRENVDFDHGGAYSVYNWELFFHAPLAIAIQLSKNQRFEDAQKWFHYILDPTSTDSPDQPNNPGPERFWRVRPLYEAALQGVQTLAALIADVAGLQEQIIEWEADPFQPYVIARLRVVAYMKNVVMRYIDNLIGWGDQLFRQDTIESINEATQLYVLASQMLGQRPESIPPRALVEPQTFRTLDDFEPLDDLSNALVEIESFLPPSVGSISGGNSNGVPLVLPYFCTPANDQLLGYWDTVADRLFKIRHCMNIDGVQQTLPIFQPPIDPGLLVRAAAAGVDISSALNDINAPVPYYRYTLMSQKASELCNDVKALGSSLLAALEKQDAEELALLRSSHEVDLLKAMRSIKQQQIDEANGNLDGLVNYRDVVTARQQYYLSREFLNPFEIGHLALAGQSLIPLSAQLGAELTAAIGYLIPDAKLGAPPTIGTTYGGSNLASSVQAFGSAAGTSAAIFNAGASLSATMGGFQRRQDDWTFQADAATRELKQIDKQILAAQIRVAIAERELANHDLQIEQSSEVDAYLRDQKFTNQQLYGWIVGKLSGIYFQSYQLAYDLAKKAERACGFELGVNDTAFIQFGYWDSLKKGLLSGEQLQFDLRRMETAYLDQNRREYEITKHVSLRAIDPASWIKLKLTDECSITLPEALFDLDFPGHYMRRLKSVSVTLPCVTGPYTGVNCTLTQLTSSLRRSNTLLNSQYLRRSDDSRFSDSFGPIQSIVTSSGQNDAGLFETNLRDERYLPFEGQGAISMWRLQLPKQFKPFDYTTLSDVILHVRYTARDGGDAFGQKASDELASTVNNFIQSEGRQGFARAFSARQEFPTEWSRFLNPTDPATPQTLAMEIDENRFPFLFRGRTIAIKTAGIMLQFKNLADPVAFHLDPANPTPLGDYGASSGAFLKFNLNPPGGQANQVGLELTSSEALLNGSPYAATSFQHPRTLGAWSLEFKSDDIAAIADSLRYKITVNGNDIWRLKPGLLEDICIVQQYSI